jgi:hypothetical protein
MFFRLRTGSEASRVTSEIAIAQQFGQNESCSGVYYFPKRFLFRKYRQKREEGVIASLSS